MNKIIIFMMLLTGGVSVAAEITIENTLLVQATEEKLGFLSILVGNFFFDGNGELALSPSLFFTGAALIPLLVVLFGTLKKRGDIYKIAGLSVIVLMMILWMHISSYTPYIQNSYENKLEKVLHIKKDGAVQIKLGKEETE